MPVEGREKAENILNKFSSRREQRRLNDGENLSSSLSFPFLYC